MRYRVRVQRGRRSCFLLWSALHALHRFRGFPFRILEARLIQLCNCLLGALRLSGLVHIRVFPMCVARVLSSSTFTLPTFCASLCGAFAAVDVPEAPQCEQLHLGCLNKVVAHWANKLSAAIRRLACV